MPQIPCKRSRIECARTAVAGVPFDERQHCRFCWLSLNEERYRTFWGLAGQTAAPPPVDEEKCPHLGAATGQTVLCETCKGRWEIKLFSCAVYGECTTHKTVHGTPCCRQSGGCPGRTASPRPGQAVRAQVKAEVRRSNHRPPMLWAVGVTTVPSRRDNLLPQTLESLREAGFERPRLFVDGAANREAVWWETQYDCPVTCRDPRIRTFGNWILGIAELYIREPQADRYAMFQDDLITVSNLRQYLEKCGYPDGRDRRPQGYLNLLTFPENQELAPKNERGGTKEGWFKSNQKGRGAVALVFSREVVLRLLTSYQHIIDRPLTSGHRAWSAIDGGIVGALRKQGWHEYCHSPSLVRHTGQGDHRSSMGHLPFPVDTSFPGAGWDATQLIGVAGKF